MITKAKVKIAPAYWGTDCEEFKHFVGRYPANLKELQEFAQSISRGIDAQLDWDILGTCAAERTRMVV